VISKTTPAFRHLLKALPADVQKQAHEAFKRFEEDPAYPGLHYEQIRRRKTILHSARIGLHYRALAYEEADILY
jgi:hypothetical protein